jgi:hypothetical protein
MVEVLQIIPGWKSAHAVQELSNKKLKLGKIFANWQHASPFTLMSNFRDPFCLQELLKRAPIYAFPISQDHPNAMCRMRMPSKDPKTESPIKNAKDFGLDGTGELRTYLICQ